VNEFEETAIDIEAFGAFGEMDEFAKAKITPDGLLIEGFFAPAAGIRWEDLAKVLLHPRVQERLEESDMMGNDLIEDPTAGL
jgi:hypothetical protein